MTISYIKAQVEHTVYQIVGFDGLVPLFTDSSILFVVRGYNIKLLNIKFECKYVGTLDCIAYK